MKCPRCGTANGKNNKFCRECGLRMEWLAQRQQAPPRVSVVEAPDELELAQALGAAWELVKSGDLDGALGKGEGLLRANPDSASVHWLVASTYERKADSELARGNAEAGHDLLKRAVAQYEGIIDLNPDSAADREKLAALRRRLSGGVAAGQWISAPPTGFRAALASVPRPVLAAFGALLLIIFVMIVMIPGAGRERGLPKPEPTQGTAGPAPPGPMVTRNAPSAPPSSSSSSYPAPPPPPALGVPVAPRPQPSQPATTSVGSPSLSSAQVTIVPEPRRTTPRNPTPAVRPGPTEPKAGSSTGAKMLAEAIQLHDQGLHEESIGAAERAIALFQGEIDAGRNPEPARRGIDNAKKLVAVWEQSASAPSENQ